VVVIIFELFIFRGQKQLSGGCEGGRRACLLIIIYHKGVGHIVRGRGSIKCVEKILCDGEGRLNVWDS
jgi:hypothetical protein